MILLWEGGRVVADRAGIAGLCGLSERTVRRHCTPLVRTCRDAHPGIDVHHPDGHGDRVDPASGAKLYDVAEALVALGGVIPGSPVALARVAQTAVSPTSDSCAAAVTASTSGSPGG